MKHTLLTTCHPQAEGRTAIPGEQQWVFTAKLENGEELELKMGRVGRDSFKQMLEQEEIDDLAEMPVNGN